MRLVLWKPINHFMFQMKTGSEIEWEVEFDEIRILLPCQYHFCLLYVADILLYSTGKCFRM